MRLTEESIRSAIAANIAHCRKVNGQTQAQLAEKLNYSDKSISKWDRGEGVPDIYVLSMIAELYGVTVNDLLNEDPPLQKSPGRILIVLLSVGLVWLVTAVVYFALRMAAPSISSAWMAFLFALPVMFIVLIVFTAIWWGRLYQCISVSGLVWSLALCVHLMAGRAEVKTIYLVAGILQLLTILWFIYQSRRSHASMHG